MPAGPPSSVTSASPSSRPAPCGAASHGRRGTHGTGTIRHRFCDMDADIRLGLRTCFISYLANQGVSGAQTGQRPRSTISLTATLYQTHGRVGGQVVSDPRWRPVALEASGGAGSGPAVAFWRTPVHKNAVLATPKENRHIHRCTWYASTLRTPLALRHGVPLCEATRPSLPPRSDPPSSRRVATLGAPLQDGAACRCVTG